MSRRQFASPNDAGGARTGHSWAAFGLLYVLAAIASATLGMCGPLVQDVAASFNVSITAVGAALVCVFSPNILFGAAIGFVIDRFGARRVFGLGILLMTAMDGLQQIAWHLQWFAVNLFVQGLGVSAVLTAGQVAVSRIFTGSTQTRALAIWSSMNFVGYAGGLLIAGFAESGQGWRFAYRLHAGLGIAALLLALLAPQTPAVAVAQASRYAISAVLGELSALRISAALGAAAIAGVGTNACIALDLHLVHHVPLSWSASAAAIGNILCIPGGLLVAWCLRRGVSAPGLMSAIGAIAIAAGWVLYLPGSPLSGAIASLFVYQLCLSGMTALTYAALPCVLGDSRRLGAATGLLLQIGGIGAVLGPAIFFAAMSAREWEIAISLVAALWIVAVLVFPGRRVFARIRAPRSMRALKAAGFAEDRTSG